MYSTKFHQVYFLLMYMYIPLKKSYQIIPLAMVYISTMYYGMYTKAGRVQ